MAIDLFGKKKTKTKEVSPDGKRVTVTKSVSKNLGGGATMTKEKTVDRRRVGSVLAGGNIIAEKPEDKRKVEKSITISKSKDAVADRAKKSAKLDEQLGIRRPTDAQKASLDKAMEIAFPKGIQEKARAYGKDAVSELFKKKQMGQ